MTAMALRSFLLLSTHVVASFVSISRPDKLPDASCFSKALKISTLPAGVSGYGLFALLRGRLCSRVMARVGQSSQPARRCGVSNGGCTRTGHSNEQ